jgi:DNA-binding NtrC family response regulator
MVTISQRFHNERKDMVILIVENDTILNESMRDAVEGCGFYAMGAVDADTVRQILSEDRQNSFLLVIDSRLPGMEHFKLVGIIRDESKSRTTTLVRIWVLIKDGPDREAWEREAKRKGAEKTLVIASDRPQDILELIRTEIAAEKPLRRKDRRKDSNARRSAHAWY